MKPMLDNVIDNFFKSSLEDYEIEPSKGNWEGIKKSLDVKPENSSKSYWLAAASIILVFGLGINFLRAPAHIVKLRGSADIEVYYSSTSTYNTAIAPVEYHSSKDLTLEEVKLANEKHFLSLVVDYVPVEEQIKKRAELKINNKDEINIISNNVTSLGTNQQLAKIKIEESVAKDEDNVVTIVDDQPTFASKENTHLVEKNRIKTVGDLFNFVIAKVDNRDQKVLHFSKTEESDMELTQINLGLFKYKKN